MYYLLKIDTLNGIEYIKTLLVKEKTSFLAIFMPENLVVTEFFLNKQEQPYLILMRARVIYQRLSRYNLNPQKRIISSLWIFVCFLLVCLCRLDRAIESK